MAEEKTCAKCGAKVDTDKELEKHAEEAHSGDEHSHE